MAYYRVAQYVNHSTALQWKSTTLSSLEALFAWLRLYRAFPLERLRVFSSASRENLDEQLQRESQGKDRTGDGLFFVVCSCVRCPLQACSFPILAFCYMPGRVGVATQREFVILGER